MIQVDKILSIQQEYQREKWSLLLITRCFALMIFLPLHLLRGEPKAKCTCWVKQAVPAGNVHS